MLAREEADTVELIGSLERSGKARLPGGSAGIGAAGVDTLESLIADLNGQMLEAAAELKFELAARLRDELADLKRDLRQIQKAGHA